MTLPKPWLDDDGATSAVRDVLRTGRAGMDPPEGAQQAVWLALAAQVAAAGAAGAAAKAAAGASATTATTATTATSGAASGGLIKAILIGAFSGIVAVSGYSALAPSPPPAAPSATSPKAPAPPPGEAPAGLQGAPAAPSPEPSSSPSSPFPAAEAREPTSAPVQPASPAPSSEAPASALEAPAGTVSAAPAPGSPEERASRLREENELLGQARGALRGGDPGRAMSILEQARRKFPDGILGQEREALTIEALAKSGAREAASARAAAFIQAHPTSPHTQRLQSFILP